MAPWHIIQLFDEVDDWVHAWNLIMNDVLNDLAHVKNLRVRDKDVPYDTWMEECNLSQTKGLCKVLKKQNSRNLGA